MPKGDNPTLQFRSDGLNLSPAEYARLLADISERCGIEVDDYSRGGVVAELEERMAALLGKEAAVFLPTGTLANHLAVRRLTTGRGQAGAGAAGKPSVERRRRLRDSISAG